MNIEKMDRIIICMLVCGLLYGLAQSAPDIIAEMQPAYERSVGDRVADALDLSKIGVGYTAGYSARSLEAWIDAARQRMAEISL